MKKRIAVVRVTAEEGEDFNFSMIINQLTKAGFEVEGIEWESSNSPAQTDDPFKSAARSAGV